MKVFTRSVMSSLLLFSISIAGELKVGATPVPHAQILQSVTPVLKKQGVDLKVIVFNDYITPNLALEDKSLDANFMQHLPYLEKINKDKNLHLVSIAQIHIEPLGIYSKKIKSLDDVKKGAVISVPIDSSNFARALILLHNNGLITLKDPNNLAATERDIKKNPKKITIKRLDAGLLPKTLNDVDLSVINGNFALQAGLTANDAIALEDSRSAYANILVVRAGDENNEDVLILKNALQSEDTRKFIQEHYKGEIIPVF
ncbi:ABC transporter substrate-binding protein [Helicobacter muridarum]|uniref:ABC transporter substrate-binding protein n=1 Tax=Helicobacter muridarum TaxID=216 RepID=A0A377PRE9_9HELI|nr:MetQ/NlpA family ABC transporter substrate-binding protein [Helicobacter muridarum]TLD98696.1 ABC transporter substrate-binding protein [Helicobacter muridarum]STQ85548.1 ABC transporter substrate-binding protein [Helicobacter muridarum]